MTNVKIVQSGRFPNCHTVVVAETNECLLIFRDRWDPRGLDSLIEAHDWCEQTGHTVMEVQSKTEPIYQEMMS